jgi:valyl-tRNA synthetase
MSKSLGNGIDPIEMIEEYGADAVRYTLAALTTEGQDVKLAPTRFEMGRNFINKLWNASRFVLMNLAEAETAAGEVADDALSFEDRWILSRLAAATEEARANLQHFRYSDLALGLREFAWHDVCDWYLEIIKNRFRAGGTEGAAAARVLAHVLDTMLRLLHPLIPFITEEVWHRLAEIRPRRGLEADPPEAPADLIRAPWPTADASRRDVGVEEEMRLAQEVIRAIRNVRSKFNLSPKKELAAQVSAREESVGERLRHREELIARLAGVEDLTIGVQLEKPSQTASEVMEAMTVYVPLSGLMDVETERKRLGKELKKKQDFLRKSATKLKNEEFLAKAKPEVVARERERREELELQIEKLETLLESLGS